MSQRINHAKHSVILSGGRGTPSELKAPQPLQGLLCVSQKSPINLRRVLTTLNSSSYNSRQ